jgi:hypothetical protein
VLPVNSPRWATLAHAYGNASDVPQWLNVLASGEADERAEVWHEIWSALCHQGSAYPASYAAVPYLVELAAQTDPEDPFRVECLTFVGHVAMSPDADVVPEDLQADYAAALVRAEPLAIAALDARPDDESTVVYLLQTVAALHGCVKTANLVEGFVDGEFIPRCPGDLCGVEMYVTFDGVRMLASLEDPATEDVEEHVEVVPPAHAPRGGGAWTDEDVLPKLVELAERAGHRDLAAKLVLWDGTLACPKCHEPFPLRATLLDPTDL